MKKKCRSKHSNSQVYKPGKVIKENQRSAIKNNWYSRNLSLGTAVRGGINRRNHGRSILKTQNSI